MTSESLQRAATLYSRYLVLNGRQTDTKKILFSFLNELSLEEHFTLNSPLMVGIDVLPECNLKCTHCFRDEETLPHHQRLTTEQILDLIDHLDRIGVLETYITGGEPFLRKDIVTLVRRIKSYHMMTNIHTNGTVVRKADAEALAGLLIPAMDFVQVSIDGGKAQTHDTVRGNGTFLRTVANLRLMRDASLPLRINMVVHEANYREMIDVYRLALGEGINEVSFSPLLRTRLNRALRLPTDDTLLLEFARVLELHFETGSRDIRITQDPIAVPCGSSSLGPLLKDVFIAPRYVCPAASTAIEIDPSGEVYPCPYLHYSQFSAGNIYATPIDDIWRAGKGWAPLRGAKDLSHSACASCDFSSGCGGACAAQAFHDLGTLDAPDSRCARVP